MFKGFIDTHEDIKHYITNYNFNNADYNKYIELYEETNLLYNNP